MRLFGKITGAVDRYDRADWLTPPFDLAFSTTFATPTVIRRAPSTAFTAIRRSPSESTTAIRRPPSSASTVIRRAAN
jgi:hypothetical protein